LQALAVDLKKLLVPRLRLGPKFIARAREVDSRLHDLIAESSGNAFLAKEIARLKTLFRAFRDMAWKLDEENNDFGRLVEESHEHLAIVDALLAGDPKGAARAMARHIRSGVKYWSRALVGRRAAAPTVEVRKKTERKPS
jgi:DNA-binding GntR family transcriptional regulator